MNRTKVNRTVKIYPKVRVLNGKLITRTYYQTSQIKLEGNYLVSAGFVPHSRIRVHISDGEIVITKVSI